MASKERDLTDSIFPVAAAAAAVFFFCCFSFTNADAFYIRLKACWESGVGGVEVSNLTLVPR